MLSKHETLGLYYRCRRYLFMVSVPKPYVLRPKTVCFWFGNRTVLGQLETDSISFDYTLVHSLLNKLSNEIKTVSEL